MPHVVVKMIEGKSEEQKKDLCERIVEGVVNACDSREAAVSVEIIDIPREDWKKVYEEEIICKKGLYKEPGYEM